jgi:hypothetical protein
VHVPKRFPVGDTPVKALTAENAQFDFSHVKPTTMPWSIVDIQFFKNPPGFGGFKGFVQ